MLNHNRNPILIVTFFMIYKVPWIFETGTNIDLLKLIHTPMASSSVYTKGIDTKKRKLDDSFGGEKPKKVKGKGKGKGKGKNGGKDSDDSNKKDSTGDVRNEQWQQVLGQTSPEIDTSVVTSAVVSEGSDSQSPEESSEMEVLQSSDTKDSAADPTFAGPVNWEEDTSRPSLWLDDMVAACQRVLSFEFPKDSMVSKGNERNCVDSLLLPKDIDRVTVTRVLAVFVNLALEFCWAKKVTLGSKEFRTWSTLRPSLQELIHKTFVDLKKGAVTGVDIGAAASGSNGGGGSLQRAGNIALNRLLAAAQAGASEGERTTTGKDEGSTDSQAGVSWIRYRGTEHNPIH